MVSSLVLIPFLGTQRTFLVFASLVGATCRGRHRHPVAPVVRRRRGDRDPASARSSRRVRRKVIYETETEYQYARVVEEPDGERTLELNEGQASIPSTSR